MNIYTKNLLIIIAFSLIAACEKTEDRGTVLARVNGEAIYDTELKTNIISMFGVEKESMLNSDERKKILESMVLSRLIRQQAEKELDKEVMNSINRQSEIYKERLIINQYMKNNVDVPSVSDEMIRDYYDRHSEQYGDGIQRDYEIITTKSRVNEIDRNKLLQDYAAISEGLDIEKIYQSLSKKGHQLVYRKGLKDKDVSDSRVKSLVSQLSVDETSKLSFIDGRPYIVKVASEKTVTGRSFDDVRNEIAQKLKPMMLKQAIQQKYTVLKSGAEIEYLTK